MQRNGQLTEQIKFIEPKKYFCIYKLIYLLYPQNNKFKLMTYNSQYSYLNSRGVVGG